MFIFDKTPGLKLKVNWYSKGSMLVTEEKARHGEVRQEISSQADYSSPCLNSLTVFLKLKTSGNNCITGESTKKSLLPQLAKVI